LYIGNGQYVAAVDSAGAFSANVLDLPSSSGFKIAHLYNSGTSLLILAYKSTLAKEIQYGLFTWDNLSPTYNENYFNFGAAAIYGFGKVDDIVCAVGYATYKDAENKLLTIYHYDGSSLSSFKKIKVEDTYPLSIVNSGEDMLIASKSQVMTITRNLDGSPISVIGSHNVSLGNKANITEVTENPASAVNTTISNVIGSYAESNYSAEKAMQSIPGGATKLTQWFTPSVTKKAVKCKFYLKKVGTPLGNITATLSIGRSFGGPITVATSNAVSASSLGTSYGLVEFVFPTPLTVYSGSEYVLSINYGSGTSTNYIAVGYDNTDPTDLGSFDQTYLDPVFGTPETAAIEGTLIFYLYSLDTDWTNPTNVYTSNDAVARAYCDSLGDTSYLDITDLSFEVPSTATIVGVKVEAEAKQEFVLNTYLRAQLIKGGTPTGSVKTTLLPNSDEYKSFGDLLDMWGVSLAYTDVNADTFGVRLQAYTADTGTKTVSIDHVRITVYYTTVAGIADNYGAFLNNVTNTLYLGGAVTQTVNLSGGLQDTAVIETPIAHGKFNTVRVHYKTLNGGTIGIETDSDESGNYQSQTVINDDINKVAYFDGGLSQERTLQARITLNSVGGNTPVIKAIELI